jgi:hypothetical protein
MGQEVRTGVGGEARRPSLRTGSGFSGQNSDQDRVQLAQRQLDHPARLDDEGRFEA